MRRRVRELLFALPAALVMSCTYVQAFTLDPLGAQSNVSASPSNDLITRDSGQDPCHFPPPQMPLDLLDAVERALCNNARTRQVWANVKIRAAGLALARSAYLPTAAASLSLSEGRISSGGNSSTAVEARSTQRSASLELGWTLLDFGVRRARLENARQLLFAAHASQNEMLQRIFSETAEAYYAAVSAAGLLDASENAERSAKESFLAASARYQAGAGTLADKLQAQTMYGQATLTRVRTEGELRNGLGVLAIMIGLEVNTPIAVSGGDTVLPDSDFVKSIDALIEEAKQQHPGLLAAQSNLRAAQENVKSTRAEGLPTVSLTAATRRSDQQGSSFADNYAFSSNIGVQVNIPLSEGLGRMYRVRAAQADVELKAADMLSVERQITLNVWTSYQALRTETENLKTTDELLQSALQSFNVAQGRYKAGMGSILELLSAQSSFSSAGQQRVQALSNWRSNRLKLAASLGRLGFWAIR